MIYFRIGQLVDRFFKIESLPIRRIECRSYLDIEFEGEISGVW